MKREEIIRDLVERSSGAGAGQYISIRCDVAREIVALLREQEARVMKYDEMIVAGKENRAVYLEAAPEFGLRPRWGIATEGMEPPVERAFTYPGGTAFNAEAPNEIMYDGDFYNKNMNLGWRAWTARPTPEQMRDTPWEEENETV